MKNIFVGDDTCFNGLRDFVSNIFFLFLCFIAL